MNPLNFVKDVIKLYHTKKSLVKTEDLSKPIFTIDDMINMVARIKKIMEENTEFEIIGKTMQGDLLEAGVPYKVKQIKFEESYIIQPLVPIADKDYEELHNILNAMNEENSFNGKPVFILPDSVQAIRARIDYSTVEEKDKWVKDPELEALRDEIMQGLKVPPNMFNSTPRPTQANALLNWDPGTGTIKLEPTETAVARTTVNAPTEEDEVTVEFNGNSPSGVVVKKNGIMLVPEVEYTIKDGVVTLK